MKKKFNLLWVISLALITGFTACEKGMDENYNLASDQPNSDHKMVRGPIGNNDNGNYCNPIIKDLSVDNNISVGTVTILTDDANLYVQFSTVDDWIMKKAFLYVGSKDNLSKYKNGHAMAMHYPYKINFNKKTAEYVFKIPINEIDMDCFIVSAGAEVNNHKHEGHKCGDKKHGDCSKSQHAWVDGERFESKKKHDITYFDHCKCVTSTPIDTEVPFEEIKQIYVPY